MTVIARGLAPCLALGFAVAVSAADAAELVNTPSELGVDATVEKLTETIEGAGARVFAVVDHGGGAQSVGEDIGASKLVIFGSPAVGTPAMLSDRQAGLFLPLKALVYEDTGGTVQVLYEDPAAMLSTLDGISGDEEFLARMAGALNNFVTKATTN